MTALLVIIYISFISLGLPDSLLGSAWPLMQVDLSAQFGMAGIISMIICAGTIVSSLFSNHMIAKFGTGKVTLFSVTMTALALLGFSVVPHIYLLCVVAVPLGLGAGSVDAALNNFVALHYKAKHMSWLHCFWGIGATAGPAIMSIFLLNQGGWKTGYRMIGIIQICLVALLLFTLPLWKKFDCKDSVDGPSEKKLISNREAIKIPYVKLAFISFIFFAATELTTGLWSSSFLVNAKGLSVSDAARWTSYFYAGITVGRFVSGFLAAKIKSHVLIRTGQITCIVGALFLMLPLPVYCSMLGIILIGLGTAPIYPCMLHETPNRFGKDVSQAVMGLQMAFAYIGSTLIPPLFGGIATITNIKIFPYFLLCCVLIMFFASEILQKKIAIKKEVPNADEPFV